MKDHLNSYPAGREMQTLQTSSMNSPYGIEDVFSLNARKEREKAGTTGKIG